MLNNIEKRVLADKMKEDVVGNKLKEKSLKIKNSPSYHVGRENITSALYDNFHNLAFFDGELVETGTGEKLLMYISTPQTLNNSDGRMPLSVERGKEDHNINMNPITYALHVNSSLPEELREVLEKKKSFNWEKIESMEENEVDLGLYRSVLDIKFLLEENRGMTFNNRFMIYLIDTTGNIFIAQEKFLPLEETSRNILQLQEEGLEAYLSDRISMLPLLEEIKEKEGSLARFSFNKALDTAVDFKTSPTFYEDFTTVYDLLRPRLYNDKANEDMYFHRKVDNGIVRFKVDGKNYIILPDDKKLGADYQTYDTKYLFAKNEVTLENYQNFLSTDTKIYYLGTDGKVTSNVLQEKSDGISFKQPPLFDLIYYNALPIWIKLYLYGEYTLDPRNETGPLYEKFTIKQESGKVRTIHAPTEELKELSRELNTILAQAVETSIRRKGLGKNVMGYRPGINVQDNAAQHKNNSKIIKLDFTKYFDSIKSSYTSHVFRFLADPSKEVRIKVEELLAGKPGPVTPYRSSDSYITVRGKYPTMRYYDFTGEIARALFFNPETDGLYMGNPISGALSNLIILKVVKYVKNICDKHGITFTIYADDLTFSAGKETDMDYFNPKYLEYIVEHALESLNLPSIKLNKEKTIKMKDQKRRITGIRVNHNNELTWDRKKYYKLRAVLDRLDKTNDINATTMDLNELRGNLTFFSYTENHNEFKEINKIERLLTKYSDTLVRNEVFTEEQVERMKKGELDYVTGQ